MLSNEDRKRIEAEEAYRAQVRSGGRQSQVKIGMKREAGSILFRLIAILVLLAVWLVGCVLLSRG